MTTNRDQVLRAALIGEVRRAARRRRWTLPLLGLGGFVVAGALTAGALVGSGVFQPVMDQQEASALVASGLAGDARLLGAPVLRVTDDGAELTLGARPAGARHVAVGLQCTATRTVSVSIDGGRSTTASCGSAVVLDAPAGAHDRPTVTVEPRAAGAMTVWAAWAEPDPLPGPSEQQRAALADGVVTRSEYVAAWQRWTGCMRALGHPVGADLDQVVIVTGVPTEAERVDARCGAAELVEVDSAWQAEHPDAPAYSSAAGARWTAEDDPRFAG